MSVNLLRVFAAVLCALGVAMQVHAAATITIIPGEGFDDSTPTAPVAGNPGTTLGAQRLYLFQKAAQQWGVVLNSAVEIRVAASMGPDTCNGDSAVLGSTMPVVVNADFSNNAFSDTWYVGALANAIAGSDLDVANDDIDATFNGDIDSGACLTGFTWWYGVDPAVPVPADKVGLLPLVFQRLAHGLGFISLTNPFSGEFCCTGDEQHPDIWSWYMRDAATGVLWVDMTDSERQDSAQNDPNLTWVGRNVNRLQSEYLAAAPMLTVNTPPAIAGSNPAAVASFGPRVPPTGITGSIALAEDGSTAGGGTVNDACEPLTNAADVAGKITLVERGICNFVVKVKNAQNAGARAVVVQNNVDPDLPPSPMGGVDPTITIPTIGITQALGTSIRANLGGGVNVTMGDPTKLSSTQGGCVRLNAPSPQYELLMNSYFPIETSPDLLMRARRNISYLIFERFDLTLELLKDIGWQTNPADDLLHADGFDPNPCPFVVPY